MNLLRCLQHLLLIRNFIKQKHTHTYTQYAFVFLTQNIHETLWVKVYNEYSKEPEQAQVKFNYSRF